MGKLCKARKNLGKALPTKGKLRKLGKQGKAGESQIKSGES